MVDRHLTQSDRGEESPPLFSVIEFNLTGLCNRTCVFCPRHDPRLFPNVNKHMTLDLFDKVTGELGRMGYEGLILFSGFCEPLLHPQLEEILHTARRLCPQARLELVSNGDLVNTGRLKDLIAAGLDTILLSMYDGPHQEEEFTAMREEAGLSPEQVILRVRWLPPEENYGIILSNRGGLLDIPQIGVRPLAKPRRRPCFYPLYAIIIDYDGLSPLCAHDWGRKLLVGDLNRESLMEFWTSDLLRQVRLELAQGRRTPASCLACDVDGTLNGRSYLSRWLAYYGILEPGSEDPRPEGE